MYARIEVLIVFLTIIVTFSPLIKIWFDTTVKSKSDLYPYEYSVKKREEYMGDNIVPFWMLYVLIFIGFVLLVWNFV